MKVSTVEFDRNTGFLFKGPPGFGKTIAACSAAIFGPVFLAYIDKRAPIEVLAFYRKYRPDLLDNIEYESYGAHNINEYHNKMIEFTKNCPYVAVITDSVTSLTSAAVGWSMAYRTGQKHDKQAKDSRNTAQLIPDWDEYKVETSLVTQCLDMAKTLNVMNIWTAHPLSRVVVKGSGASVDSVTKSTSLVSYGSKVGDLIPGSFQEIYHFGSQGGKRVVWTNMVGDDFAKTVFDIPKQLDIDGKLFFEVWREAVNKSMEVENEVKSGIVSPFAPAESKWKV